MTENIRKTVERVQRYMGARTGMRGLDPDSIHEVGTEDGVVALRLSDLRALLAHVGLCAACMSSIGHPEVACPGCDRVTHFYGDDCPGGHFREDR